MTVGASERTVALEGVRDKIVDTLVGNGDLSRLGVKELTLLEKTISGGVKVELDLKKLALLEKNEASESAMRDAATQFILAQREAGNQRVKMIREGQMQGGASALPEVEKRELLPNEGTVGQLQVDYEVLSGVKAFVPEENVVSRERLPDVDASQK